MDFLGRTNTPEGVMLQAPKIEKFLSKLKFQRTKKALQRYLGFLNYYRNYISTISEKLTPFFKLLKTNEAIKFSPELMQLFHELSNVLDNCCKMALKQPVKDNQMVLMTDESFVAAAHALMTEHDTEQNVKSKRKTYAPVAFGSKTYNPSQTKLSIYAKEVFSNLFRIRGIWAPVVG